MTNSEKEAILAARKEGRIIEYLTCDNDWRPIDVCCPLSDYDFETSELRIKPDFPYREFKNRQELIEAIQKHGLLLIDTNFKWGATILSYDGITITTLDDNQFTRTFFGDALWKFEFADGTPFGVKIE